MEDAFDIPDQEQPSLLEYARYHGLVRDHLSIDPLHFIVDGSVPFSCTDNDEAPELFLEETTQPLFYPQSEKLAIGRDVAVLLSSILRPPSPELDDAYAYSKYRRIKDAKIELPLLRRSDHELDKMAFKKPMQASNVLEDLNLPFASVDNEEDEGLGWPSATAESARRFEEDTRVEKLALSRETMFLLQACLSSAQELVDDDLIDMDEAHRTAGKCKPWEPITPPLSPLAAPLEPFLPSSPIEHLKALPDVSSPSIGEHRRFEEVLRKECSILPLLGNSDPLGKVNGHDLLPDAIYSIGEIHSPLNFLDQTSSSPIRNNTLPYQQKVDSPLIPLMTMESPPRTTDLVSIQEAMKDLNPDRNGPVQRPWHPLSEDDGLDDFFSTMKPLADQANRELEQEQLQEADSTKRVQVPIMDFSVARPPWEPPPKTATGRYWIEQEMRTIKAENPKMTMWPGSNLLDRRLTWTPFPTKLGKISLDEYIGDMEVVTEFLDSFELGKQVDSTIFAWKPEGLRILDEIENEDTDDDEIEPDLHEQKQPFAKGLKRVITQKDEDFSWERIKKQKIAQIESNALISPPAKDREIAPPRFEDEMNKTLKEAHLEGRALTAVGLHNFMKTRKQAWHKASSSQYFPQEAAPSTSADERLQYMETKLAKAPSSSNSQDQDSRIPVLELNIPPGPRPFIVSAAILSQRSLMRRLRRLYPEADFIERDFSTAGPSLNGLDSSDISHPSHPHLEKSTNEEADLITSPGTGVIWTTMQKVRQRALPGQQKARSEIRERITRVHRRYEKVFVLVWECQQRRAEVSSSSHKTVDGTDCQMLAELSGFATGLGGAEIVVLYVAGGEEELACWITRLMVEYGVGAGALPLVQEETMWELFLRRAGFNAFAAQEILAELSSHTRTERYLDESVGSVEGESALVEFVSMTPDQRLARFEHLFEGGQLLHEVSAVLDASWE
ncbi:MAG: hypothetical protein M4579_001308 [Chaenotheca gracillima]|nr:MAG: hypothetical protein M4579_001308 [Chaenotheca gracillima]